MFIALSSFSLFSEHSLLKFNLLEDFLGVEVLFEILLRINSGIVRIRTFSSNLAQEIISSFSRSRILFTSVRKVIRLSSVSRVRKMAELAWREGRGH